MPRLRCVHLPRPTISTTSLTLLVSLFIVLADNRLLWETFSARLGLHTWSHWAFLSSSGLVLILLLNVLLSLFTFRPILKPFLIFLLLTAAAISYFSDNFGIAIDRSMIHNILETDLNEASELLTWPLYRHLLLFGILPAAVVALARLSNRSQAKELLTRIGILLGSLALFLALGVVFYKQIVLFGRENRDLQILLNPVYAIYSLQKVLQKKYFSPADAPLQVVAADAVRTGTRPRSAVVLVLGETARAREFAFSGYERDTNPQLASRGIFYFPNVQACGTSTAESLPCIFSALERKNYKRNRAARQENVLDILQRTGVEVLWRDNNSGSKGVADRVRYEDLSHAADADLCRSGNCFDEILLRDLDLRLAETTGDSLIVLHMKGSHGPSYYRRTPPAFKVFLPECARDNIQDCPRQSIVNAYDNTILYTDHVLAGVIDLLQEQDFATAMLYVSDHGESLGENGLYLHGLPYALAPEEQTHVPMIFWASDAFARQKFLPADSLDAWRQAPYSHDVIFHSLLGLFDVNSQTYDANLDIFSTRRK